MFVFLNKFCIYNNMILKNKKIQNDKFCQTHEKK